MSKKILLIQAVFLGSKIFLNKSNIISNKIKWGYVEEDAADSGNIYLGLKIFLIKSYILLY